MTDSQYGNYQTPSSRPPEPPYRSEYPASNQQAGTTSPSDSHLGDTQTMPKSDNLYDGYPQTPRASYQSPAAPYTPSAASASAERAAAQVGAAHQRQSSGAGKTFLFGFLGALVACALAFGGFVAWNGSNGSALSSAASTSAIIGSSDSSVINAVEEGQTLAEAVAAKALPSVVAVYNYQQATSSYGLSYGYTSNSNSNSLQASGMGSGVVISNDGYILTNYHVVEDADKLTVKVGDEERDAKYVGGDESSDIAVVKIDDMDSLTAADIGDSDQLVIGEWVMTVGAPLGLEQSVATGVVSATNRSEIMSDSSSDMYSYFNQGSSTSYTYYPNMIQTDAVINPGNSGGALVDADGKLIGINTMISSYSGDYAGVGFAIPVNYAIGIATQIIDGKTPTHAMLGVSISSVNSTIAQRYNLSSDTGAYVSSISEGTGAADSDLEVGDIITAIDGDKIESTTDVTLDIRAHNPGDTVTVTVNRNGETKDIEVVLSSDESLQSSSNDSEGSGNGSNGNGNNGSGNGNGYGYGNGNGNGSGGYSQDELRELLRLFGMM